MRGFCLAVLLVATAAHAEKVKTNQATKLRSRPGEHADILLAVKSGQSMTVLSKENVRWLKVRVSGRTGYIVRTTVDLPEGDDTIQRNTRRRPFVDGRSTHRGFGGEEGPDDRVGADAIGTKGGGDDDASEPERETKTKTKPKSKTKEPEDDDSEPKSKPKSKGKPKDKDPDEDKSEAGGEDDKDKDKSSDDAGDQRPTAHVSQTTTARDEPAKGSEPSFKAKPGDTLYVEKTKGKWTMVSVEEGDAGWIETDKLDIEGGSSGGTGRRVIDARARVGVTIISQGLRTPGGALTVPDNYNISSSAATVDIGATYLYPYSKDILLGGEFTYQYALAIPGVPYKDPTTMVSSTTSFTIHDFDLRAVAGYDLHNSKGMVVYGHLGFRYQGYLVADVIDFNKNTARIPSETFKAPTIGAALAIPKVTPTIGLNFHVDLAAVGTSVTQTKNLEDGGSPSGKQFNLGAGFLYKWKSDMDIAITYDLSYGSYSFGDPSTNSMRQHTGNGGVTRTDIFHSLTAGIAKSF